MKLNTTSKKILSSVIISAMTGFGLQAQKVTAMIDSVTLEMGRTTAIHLEEIVPAGTSLILTARPETMLTPGVEIVTVTEPDTTDIGNNLLQIKRDLYHPVI